MLNWNTRRRRKRKELFVKGIMAGNGTKLITDTKTQTQEAWKIPSKINIKITTPRHIILKLQKTKNYENLERGLRRMVKTLPLEEL